MDIFCYENNFPYIVIDNYYTEDEYKLIWEEINFLCYDYKLPKSTGSATDDMGNRLKNNRAVYLDNVYGNDRSISSILSINQKLFNNSYEILRNHPSWFFQNIRGTRDNTSLSYYEDDEEYPSHYDEYSMTALWWTCRKPKKFEGGNFIFSDYNETVEFKDNRMIIFPSIIMHRVTKVIMQEQYLKQKNGRICLTQFLKFKD